MAWTSSHPKRAVVSREGLVRALKPGGVTITAKCGGQLATASLDVVSGVADTQDSGGLVHRYWWTFPAAAVMVLLAWLVFRGG